MTHIITTQLKFDPVKMLAEANELYSRFQKDQINLRKPHQIDDAIAILYGSGSLYQNGRVIDRESSWDCYIEEFKHLYITDVIKEIEQYTKYVYSANIGRARLMKLKQKSNLTMHVDRDDYLRIHVPIKTNADCFFVNDDTVGRMTEVGEGYIFNSRSRHTAINASREDRIHLVVNVLTNN